MNDTTVIDKPQATASNLERLVSGSGRCPDYDSDCAGMEDHWGCWLGMPPTFFEDIGEVIYTPMAKGSCPFLKGH